MKILSTYNFKIYFILSILSNNAFGQKHLPIDTFDNNKINCLQEFTKLSTTFDRFMVETVETFTNNTIDSASIDKVKDSTCVINNNTLTLNSFEHKKDKQTALILAYKAQNPLNLQQTPCFHFQLHNSSNPCINSENYLFGVGLIFQDHIIMTHLNSQDVSFANSNIVDMQVMPLKYQANYPELNQNIYGLLLLCDTTSQFTEPLKISNLSLQTRLYNSNAHNVSFTYKQITIVDQTMPLFSSILKAAPTNFLSLLSPPEKPATPITPTPNSQDDNAKIPPFNPPQIHSKQPAVVPTPNSQDDNAKIPPFNPPQIHSKQPAVVPTPNSQDDNTFLLIPGQIPSPLHSKQPAIIPPNSARPISPAVFSHNNIEKTQPIELEDDTQNPVPEPFSMLTMGTAITAFLRNKQKKVNPVYD